MNYVEASRFYIEKRTVPLEWKLEKVPFSKKKRRRKPVQGSSFFEHFLTASQRTSILPYPRGQTMARTSVLRATDRSETRKKFKTPALLNLNSLRRCRSTFDIFVYNISMNLSLEQRKLFYVSVSSKILRRWKIV